MPSTLLCISRVVSVFEAKSAGSLIRTDGAVARRDREREDTGEHATRQSSRPHQRGDTHQFASS